jgi:hypothetical protein
MQSCLDVLSLRKSDVRTSLQLVFRANVVNSDKERLLSLRHFRLRNPLIRAGSQKLRVKTPRDFVQACREARMQREIWWRTVSVAVFRKSAWDRRWDSHLSCLGYELDWDVPFTCNNIHSRANAMMA